MTLYHWDLPQALQDAGRVGEPRHRGLVRGLRGDRGRGVRRPGAEWITLNEPWVVAHVGYRDGRHAPGIRDAAQAVAANHHLLLAHGRAVAALRATSASGAVGITLNLTVERPVTPEAAAHAAELEARQNGVYLDPIFRGRYPELLDGDAAYSPAAVPGLVRDGDFGVIGAPLDFLGVNFYSPHYVGLLQPGRRAAPRRDGDRAGHGVASSPTGCPSPR